MAKLIKAPEVHTAVGFRHRVALTLLFDSGCRVQELCDLTIAGIFISEHSTVRLHGKENKTRTVVISGIVAHYSTLTMHWIMQNSVKWDILHSQGFT